MKEPLSEIEKIRIAKRAIDKNMDFETLKYSDYMYGRENETDSVYQYVRECKKIGEDAFDEKYSI